MDHQEQLEAIYKKALISNSPYQSKVSPDIELVTNNIERAKGVYTVLITLLIHKILNPSQDIRYHQAKLENGFSGRTIDTKYITPTLKKLKLTSMSESGWLTRGLEKNIPYLLTYDADLKPKGIIKSFLNIIDFVQNKKPNETEKIIIEILKGAIKIRDNSNLSVSPIINPDKLTIDLIINSLTEYFYTDFKIPGASKLPVIAMYSIYKILIEEVDRYKDCTLKELSSHTAPDRNSKSCGDIEIFKNEKLLESLEIKFGKLVDELMVDVAIEKINQFSPSRYLILSTKEVLERDADAISNKVITLKVEHGCQLIINGLIPTIKYYLRLIDNTENFINIFTELIMQDKELKTEHKEKWKKIYNSY